MTTVRYREPLSHGAGYTQTSEMEARTGGRNNLTMKKNDEGFTLVELLIVIVILGILAAVVVFAVSGITNNADENACKTEKRTLETGIEAYYAQYNTYPASQGALVPGILRDTPTYFTSSGATVSAVSGAPCS